MLGILLATLLGSASLIVTAGDDAEAAQADELQVRLVANAGVWLSDGETDLFVDLPYQSGAHGYMTYDASVLKPLGDAVSLITHVHTDHYDRGLFLETDWKIIGPKAVVQGVPKDRVIVLEDVMHVGEFTIVPTATQHRNLEHYSYLVTWRGRRLYFPGDAEDPSALFETPGLDLLFITSWLSCSAERAGRSIDAARRVEYHRHPTRPGRVCLGIENLEPLSAIVLRPAGESVGP